MEGSAERRFASTTSRAATDNDVIVSHKTSSRAVCYLLIWVEHERKEGHAFNDLKRLGRRNTSSSECEIQLQEEDNFIFGE
jgi:hypothetical protein